MINNKKSFNYILQQSNRKIVIHHTYNIPNILQYLKNNDLIFFDDCLYSQYVFIKNNIDILLNKNIICVIGFSAEIYRRDIENPIYEADCAQYHKRIHNNDKTALNGYMSLNEIKYLLQFDNIYLACHGAKHLNLQNMSLTKFEQANKFAIDVKNATELYKQYNFKTNIFVYPYAYDHFPLAEKFLNNNGYMYIFAGENTKRIQIEDLVQGRECKYNGI